MKPAYFILFTLLSTLIAGAPALVAQQSGSSAGSAADSTLRDWNAAILGNGVANGSQDSAGLSQDYRIGSEDLLEIAVFEVPELSRTVRVSSSGDISLPLLFAWIAGTGTALLREDRHRPRHREVITLGKDQAVPAPDSSDEPGAESDTDSASGDSPSGWNG